MFISPERISPIDSTKMAVATALIKGNENDPPMELRLEGKPWGDDFCSYGKGNGSRGQWCRVVEWNDPRNNNSGRFKKLVIPTGWIGEVDDFSACGYFNLNTFDTVKCDQSLVGVENREVILDRERKSVFLLGGRSAIEIDGSLFKEAMEGNILTFGKAMGRVGIGAGVLGVVYIALDLYLRSRQRKWQSGEERVLAEQEQLASDVSGLVQDLRGGDRQTRLLAIRVGSGVERMSGEFIVLSDQNGNVLKEAVEEAKTSLLKVRTRGSPMIIVSDRMLKGGATAAVAAVRYGSRSVETKCPDQNGELSGLLGRRDAGYLAVDGDIREFTTRNLGSVFRDGRPFLADLQRRGEEDQE